MYSFDESTKDKLLYLMQFLDHYIEHTVYDVLNDSDTDPEYSAVTTTNLLKCFRDVQVSLEGSSYYSDIKSYFEEKLLSSEEYADFEAKRIKEEAYYRNELLYKNKKDGVTFD